MEGIATKKGIRWGFKNKKTRSLRKSWIKAQRASKNLSWVAKKRNWNETRARKIRNRKKKITIRRIQEKNGNEKTETKRAVRIINKNRNRNIRGNWKNEQRKGNSKENCPLIMA